jgi:hypothetical protein
VVGKLHEKSAFEKRPSFHAADLYDPNVSLRHFLPTYNPHQQPVSMLTPTMPNQANEKKKLSSSFGNSSGLKNG